MNIVPLAIYYKNDTDQNWSTFDSFLTTNVIAIQKCDDSEFITIKQILVTFKQIYFWCNINDNEQTKCTDKIKLKRIQFALKIEVRKWKVYDTNDMERRRRRMNDVEHFHLDFII